MRNFMNIITESMAATSASTIPDICDRIKIEGSDHCWRVTGWVKKSPPLDTSGLEDWEKEMHDQIAKERGPNAPPRLEWCTREEAEYVTGSGVCGIIKPIDQVKVVGRVEWPDEQIQEAHDRQKRRIGQSIR